MTNLTIQVLEAKHWDLVQQRINAMAEAAKTVDPRQHPALIEHFNNDPFWETRFDEIADQIRAIDPNHSFLPENNPE